jgi:hypothetical protein
VPDGSGTPLEAYAEMRWFRSNARFGSRLALLALAIQFLLSFGHFHGSAQAASASVDAKRSGFHGAIGFVVAHLRASDSVSLANASAPARSKPSADGRGGEPGEDCAICAVMALANALVDALQHLAVDAAFVDPNPARSAFQPRAPPIG